MKVRAYLKNTHTVEFSARNLANAKEIAYRIVTECLWIEETNGDMYYYPITEVEKVRIIQDEKQEGNDG
jgi:hypothetical protein